MPKKPTKKLKDVEAWGICCSRLGITRAYCDKDKAKEYKLFLDDEYIPDCKHEVIPVIIKPIIKKK